jgi:hypothetical protein
MDRPVRKRDVPLRARLLAFLLLLFLATDAFSLPMGINKVRYHEDQRWTILETEHFEIYHSQGCEELAQIASK